jgi:hypothetical protein
LYPNHEQKLNEIAEELFDYVDEVKIIKDLFDALPVKMAIASPYLNFRDALFHYKKMYESALNNDDYNFTKQCACIEEHLNRGLKDFAIHLCNNHYIFIINNIILNKEKGGKKELFKKLRKIYHEIKNTIVDIRLTGQSLQHYFGDKNVWLPKMVRAIRTFNNLMASYPILRRYYNQYSKVIKFF